MNRARAWGSLQVLPPRGGLGRLLGYRKIHRQFRVAVGGNMNLRQRCWRTRVALGAIMHHHEVVVASLGVLQQPREQITFFV
ncbi:MAG: hypothetical protein HC904_02605 [Blastochloris sp.]|nr:hypothetical protein [Blastochloris sp.]